MGKRTKRTKRTTKVDFENKKAHGNKSIRKIIDVPFSKKKSLGTRATKGNIEFHYQKYANMDNFFNKINLKNLSPNLFYIDLICINDKITPIYQKDIKLKKQFTLVVINITTNEGNHANIALINNHNKTIEFFEPHGYRKNKNSGIGNFKGLYLKKVQILKNTFLKLLPDHTFINMVDHKRLTSFQTNVDPDENTGFCITWCILYVHYRCLNPRILLPRLINYLSNKITEPKLLKYAKFVEETAKK
jgi:hypothetical protein